MPYDPKLTELVRKSGMIFADVRYKSCFTTPDDSENDGDHIHDFYEIYVNLDGDVSFLVGDRLYPIRRGDIILTRPSEFHRCIYHSACIHEHICIWFSEFPAMTDMMHLLPPDCNLIVLPDDKKKELISSCLTLHESCGDDMLQFRAAQSFFAILDLVCTSRREAPAPSALPDAFHAIVEHISKHYSDPACTIAGLCREFYVSRSTLCRQFRRHFQMTPSDFIESKRFSEAKKRLLAGCSVQDTCFFCGFSDCSYFIKRFRSKFGMTPACYQKKLTENGLIH